jgi:hypothetical protein
MADIFTRTNDEREKAAGSKEPDAKVVKPTKPPVDFFRKLPPDPEKEAAKAEALKRLLRDR